MTRPPLPEPAQRSSAAWNVPAFYTAEQVRAYGEACALAERERCAKKCDDAAAILRRDPDEKKQISAHMADWLAAAIRSAE